MEEAKYYCKKCGAEIKPTDKNCPKCGSILAEVGRRIELTLIETLGLSDEVKAELSEEQLNTIHKVWDVIKDRLPEIDSITIGFPQLISITLKSRKKEKT